MPAFDWGAAAQALRDWGLELSGQQRGQAERYLSLVLEHNNRVNLTADCEPGLLLTRHLLDGLAAAAILRRRLSQPFPRLADLGSGGGFVGIAVKIAWPQAEVTLIDSLSRRFNFLNLAAVTLGMRGLKVIKQTALGRVADGLGPFDAVIERALAPLPEALRLCLPLALPRAGLALAYQSRPVDPQEPEIKKALAAGAARLVECWPYRLPSEGQDRYLALFERN